MSVYITNPTLFVKPSTTVTEGSLSQLVDLLKQLDLTTLIDLTYALLTKPEHCKLNELLAIWEIRLLLHVVTYDLKSAKIEGVNLINALYMRENSISIGAPMERQEVYPLPKNNDGIIQYGLLILMLRLKSTVDMNLVNEVYKLGYQIRLKNPDKLKLQNLSYYVMSILITTNGNWTLLNFTGSLIFQLSQNASINEIDKLFLSNVTALEFLVEKILGISPSKTEDVLNTFLLPETVSSVKYLFKTESLATIESVDQKDIISLLGLWELSNTYGAKIENNDFILHASEPLSEIDLCYQLIFRHWREDCSRVFCFEKEDSVVKKT